ncbi:MAG: hypothetical protein OXB95_08140 [Rhodobacteraceae bacterium]|nr:hypothetical protein [Paracoccaceae bacterium]
MTRLHNLFAIDPKWTEEQLIVRLSLARTAEAEALWSAYGWSPSVGTDLLQAFKEPFLEMLWDGVKVDRREGNLTALSMTTCLSCQNA